MNGWVQGDPAEDLTPSLDMAQGPGVYVLTARDAPFGLFMYWRENQVSWLAMAKLVMLKRMMDDEFLGWKRTNGLAGWCCKNERKGKDGKG